MRNGNFVNLQLTTLAVASELGQNGAYICKDKKTRAAIWKRWKSIVKLGTAEHFKWASHSRYKTLFPNDATVVFTVADGKFWGTTIHEIEYDTADL